MIQKNRALRTSYSMSSKTENLLLIQTNCFRFLRYEDIKVFVTVQIPYKCLIFFAIFYDKLNQMLFYCQESARSRKTLIMYVIISFSQDVQNRV